jgi:hypothetical protein
MRSQCVTDIPLSAETPSAETLSAETPSVETLSAETLSAETLSAETLSAETPSAETVLPLSGLMENICKKGFLYDIDIVLEGGCMNGAYELGGLMLLKEMEKGGNIKVNRLSGASVGALLSVLYIIDELDKYREIYKKWRIIFNESVQLKELERFIINVCTNMSDRTFKSLQKNKIFITYYDVKLLRCIIVKEYTTKRELGECVLKSCHIPYLINGEPFLKIRDEVCLDGGVPHIFKTQDNGSSKVLYMKLACLSKIGMMFNVSGEENIDGRILEGLLDTYNFFMGGNNTEMCSFVNGWGIPDIIRYNSMRYIYKSLVYMFVYILRFIKHITPYMESKGIYNKLKPGCSVLYKDLIRYMVFN